MTKNYQDAVLVSCTVRPYNITTAIYTEEKIYSPYSDKRKGFATKLSSSFGVTYRKIRDVGMKQRALKAKQNISFWSSAKRHYFFQKIMKVLGIPFRSG